MVNELKTINGLTREEMLARLCENIPEERLGHNYAGYAYFGIQVYQDRLNSVVGGGNFDYVEDALCTTVVGGVTAVNIRGTITIRYDDGSVCLQRSAYGSENVGVKSDKDGAGRAGEPNDLSNSIKAAATDAFVQCCRKLGIAEQQLRAIRASDKKQNKSGNGDRQRRIADQSYRVKISGPCTKIGDKGFKVPALIDNGEKVNLKIWVRSDAYEQISKMVGQVPDFVRKCQGSEITIVGKKGSYNGEAEIEASSLVVKQTA